MTDIIGDIHGHAEKLKALLRKLGYNAGNGNYHHPSHKVVFIGDYIDRGPHIPETLDIVRRMVDNGNAIALMGNHEYNALCFHQKAKDGGYLRPHSIKNILQQSCTFKQFMNNEHEYEEWIAWFRTLPLYHETEQYRAVHACWDDEHIDYLKSNKKDGILTDDFLFESIDNSSPLYRAVEDCLKGKELQIPNGHAYEDADLSMRSDFRIRWWEDPSNATYRSYSVKPLEFLPDTPVSGVLTENYKHYKEDQKPVFFGHYSRKDEPELYRDNVCCLDFNVANKGYLVAYRYDGEKKLDAKNFVFV